MEIYLDLRQSRAHSGLGFLISSVSTGRSRRPSIPASEDCCRDPSGSCPWQSSSLISSANSGKDVHVTREGQDLEISDRQCLR